MSTGLRFIDAWHTAANGYCSYLIGSTTIDWALSDQSRSLFELFAQPGRMLTALTVGVAFAATKDIYGQTTVGQRRRAEQAIEVCHFETHTNTRVRKRLGEEGERRLRERQSQTLDALLEWTDMMTPEQLNVLKPMPSHIAVARELRETSRTDTHHLFSMHNGADHIVTYTTDKKRMRGFLSLSAAMREVREHPLTKGSWRRIADAVRNAASHSETTLGHWPYCLPIDRTGRHIDGETGYPPDARVATRYKGGEMFFYADVGFNSCWLPIQFIGTTMEPDTFTPDLFTREFSHRRDWTGCQSYEDGKRIYLTTKGGRAGISLRQTFLYAGTLPMKGPGKAIHIWASNPLQHIDVDAEPQAGIDGASKHAKNEG